MKIAKVDYFFFRMTCRQEYGEVFALYHDGCSTKNPLDNFGTRRHSKSGGLGSSSTARQITFPHFLQGGCGVVIKESWREMRQKRRERRKKEREKERINLSNSYKIQ